MVCGQCGGLRSECSNPDLDWHPRTDVCWATATTEWAKRKLVKDNPSSDVGDGEMTYLDGRWVWVSQTPPPEGEDEFAD